MFNYQGVVQIKYAFIGDPARCPSSAAPQLTFPGPTPNGSFSGDGIANNLVAAISAMVSNPTGTSWFDRYGFENSTKCKGIFGPTYTAPNGAQANVHLGTRDYLLQQNWVNSTRKGYCALAAPEP
jgi:Phosphate-induced protein 1 conserved region